MHAHPMMVITEQFDSIPGSLEQQTVGSSAVALPNIPTKARMAYISLEGGSIRFTTDGTTPTSSIGHPKSGTSDFFIAGRNEMKRFRAIRSGGSDGELTITYYGVA